MSSTELTGWQGTLYVPYCAGTLHTTLQAHYESGKSGLKEADQKKVDSLLAEIAKLEKEGEGIDMSDWKKAMPQIARIQSGISEKEKAIQELTTSAMLDSFVAFVEGMGYTASFKKERTTGMIKTVHRVTLHGVTRFYVPDKESGVVRCYEVDGDNSKVLWTANKDRHGDLIPDSRTQVQRLHYAVYSPKAKGEFEHKQDRLDKACDSTKAWYEFLGISKESGGVGPTKNPTCVDLKIAPEEWLKQNPPKEKE